jgi:hypothetical protein
LIAARRYEGFSISSNGAAARDTALNVIDNGVSIVPAGRYFYDAVKPYVRDCQAEFHVTVCQHEWAGSTRN